MMRVALIAVVFFASSAVPLQMEWGSAGQWGVSSRTGTQGIEQLDRIADERGDPRDHEFIFRRLAFPQCDGWTRQDFKAWQTDFPKADRQLLIVLERLSVIDAFEREYVVRIGEHELSEFPFLYAVEVGHWCLEEQHAAELRRYLEAGGFLMVDDFWGTKEWEHFLTEWRKIFPYAPIRRLPMDHPIFHNVYDIDEVVQIPNYAQAIAGGRTYEQDGFEHEVYGIFDEHDRMMVLVMHNTDLGDAWEWAEHPRLPLKMSNYAYMMAVNAIVYAMSH